MYQKVIFTGDVAKTENGIILGKEYGSMPGRIFFEDENGHLTNATYGCIDNTGKFHAYCTCENGCRICSHTNSPACRYNRAFTNTAGYYVEI